ncbi:hypothetical protein CLOL250_01588 [Clostridium sp. L2-50]|nr:hypothetical protein CLOL250_01588 [Clostridium sp. L2-50]
MGKDCCLNNSNSSFFDFKIVEKMIKISFLLYFYK